MVGALCAPPGDRRGAEDLERRTMETPGTEAGVRAPGHNLRACRVTKHSRKSPRISRGHSEGGSCPQQLSPNKEEALSLQATEPTGRGGGFRWQEALKVTRETLLSGHFAG